MNSSYKNVLVAVPPPSHEWYKDSADALRRAAATVSLAPETRITFLSVYSQIESMGDGEVNLLPPDVLRAMSEGFKKKLAEDVNAYVKWFSDNGVASTVRIEEGPSPADIVLSVASEIKADLILLGYHHDEGIFDLFMPDVARRVAKHAPCDVLLVAPKKR